MYGGTNLLKYLYILARSLKTHCRIISFKKWKNVKNILKSFVDGLSYVCKIVEIHHKKKLSLTNLSLGGTIKNVTPQIFMTSSILG